MREAALPGVKCACAKCGKMFRERWKMLAGGVIKCQGVITDYLRRKVH